MKAVYYFVRYYALSFRLMISLRRCFWPDPPQRAWHMARWFAGGSKFSERYAADQKRRTAAGTK